MTTATQALDRLRAAIEDGQYAAGARLPAERALAVSLGLGRGTLRKALAALEREGRIRRRVGEGTFVSDGEAATLRFDAAPTPADVMEARRMLEPAIAHAAALRAKAPEIAEILRLAHPGGDVVDWRGWEARDIAFHAALAAASRNPLLSALLTMMHEMREREDWGRLRSRTLTPELQAAHARQHAAIAAAVADRDAPGAAAAMRAHLVAVETDLAGDVQNAEPGAAAPADLQGVEDVR